MVMGLHVYPDITIGLKSNNTYNVFMYNMKNNRTDNLIPLMAMLKLSKLPRFYVGCTKKCENIINPTNLGNMINKEVCQRTERTANQCHIAQFLLYGIKIIIYVVNLINSKPQTLQEGTREERIRRHIPSQQSYNSKGINKPNKYIYISVEPRKHKNLRVTRNITGSRKSPVPHTRRGHYRHLKSGKVIWVEMSYIGLKEKANRKIYKVK